MASDDCSTWLAGCSSGEINKNYYQLPVVQSGTQSTASQGNRLLWVEQVTVPDYLAGEWCGLSNQ